ncbi:MAG: NAD(P)H-hydrate dehydratase [Candidatus Levybacteria bacterium]|nr:NAD(P)H-hydrate dehydratase [Candidatus Levybacteria bacterium]
MEKFNEDFLKSLYRPKKESHKGQNGKLMIIGGSHLFHGASLWALKVASRIVDMVFYSSIPQNNELAQKLKSEIYDLMIVQREEIESYIQEADCVLLGPGMVRTQEKMVPTVDYQIKNMVEILEIEDEGIQTYYITKYLLYKYPDKKWVIDAGSLQMMEPGWLKQLKGNVIITPHRKEFSKLFNFQFSIFNFQSNQNEEMIKKMAEEYNCTILLKGPEDIVCGLDKSVRPPALTLRRVEGGNEGMTKGGTGDVLAGLTAALSCKNDLFLAACAASFINKKAGDELYKRVGSYFNASDLADEIPGVMKNYIAEPSGTVR